MKHLFVVVAILMCCGCTSLRPVQVPADQIHERIAAGEIVHAGDRVKIATTDGKRHEFRVTAVTTDTLSGKQIEIPIADVVTVETRHFSAGKTAALAGGTTLVYIMLALGAAVAALAGG